MTSSIIEYTPRLLNKHIKGFRKFPFPVQQNALAICWLATAIHTSRDNDDLQAPVHNKVLTWSEFRTSPNIIWHHKNDEIMLNCSIERLFMCFANDMPKQ